MPLTVHRGHCLWLRQQVQARPALLAQAQAVWPWASPRRRAGPWALDTWGGPPPVDCAVHHGWCVDMRVPASACAKTKPKGLPPPQPGGKGPHCGDTPSIHTGPILSHNHWTDSAIETTTTDREQRTRTPQPQLPAPVPESGTHLRLPTMAFPGPGMLGPKSRVD